MKKVLIATCLLCGLALAAASVAALAQSTPDRPPNVPQEKWLSINDSLGVAVHSVPTLGPEGAFGPRLQGRLMAKVGSKWVVVEMSETFGLRVLPAR